MEEDSIDDLLQHFGLAFDIETRLIYCHDSLCQRYLISSVFFHMKRDHGVTISKTKRTAIENFQVSNPSVYTLNCRVALLPITGVPVFCGYECTICIYFCRTKSTMDLHQKKSKHATAAYTKCHVQTLDTTNHPKYFKVSGDLFRGSLNRNAVQDPDTDHRSLLVNGSL
jgi:hypothetical protein